VDALGGVAYIPFKTNGTEGNGSLWDKMPGTFLLHREEFLKKYHPRSNVESSLWYELGIEPAFGQGQAEEGPAVLPMRRPG
jgi:hypothetical protein